MRDQTTPPTVDWRSHGYRRVLGREKSHRDMAIGIGDLRGGKRAIGIGL